MENDLEFGQEKQFNDAISNHTMSALRTRRPRSVSVPNTVLSTKPLVKTTRTSQVIKEGWIKKKSKDNWNRTYAILLSNNELRLYDTEHITLVEIQPTPSEIINIDTVTSVKSIAENDDIHKHCIQIQTLVSKREEIFLFSMDTQELAQQWLSLLQDLKPV